mmetsp:Transcript_125056/g.220216  ORF Transcript_125056/g.220216 Transcript_125056/m.220216 type:complete len:231 (+) Transcript_125056:244-936(+)
MPRQSEAPVETVAAQQTRQLNSCPCTCMHNAKPSSKATAYRSHPCPEPDLHAHARRSHLPHPPHLRHLRHPRPPHPHPRPPHLHPRPRPRHDHVLRPRPPHAHHLHARSLHARAPLRLLQGKQDGHRHPRLRALPLHGHPLHAHHRRAHPPHDRLLRARPLHARHLRLHHLQDLQTRLPLQAKPNGHRHLSQETRGSACPQETRAHAHPLQAPLDCHHWSEQPPRHRCPP